MSPFCHKKIPSPSRTPNLHSQQYLYMGLAFSKVMFLERAKCFLCISLHPKLTTLSTSATISLSPDGHFPPNLYCSTRGALDVVERKTTKCLVSLPQPPRRYMWIKLMSQWSYTLLHILKLGYLWVGKITNVKSLDAGTPGMTNMWHWLCYSHNCP